MLYLIFKLVECRRFVAGLVEGRGCFECLFSAGYLQVKLPLDPKANEQILTVNDLYFSLA